MALTAPDAALEVVRVLAEAFAGRGTRVEDCLDALEQLFADERFVTPLVHLALVRDDPYVVRVPEHRLNLRRRNRPGRVATGT